MRELIGTTDYTDVTDGSERVIDVARRTTVPVASVVTRMRMRKPLDAETRSLGLRIRMRVVTPRRRR
jgi:hypothetical protein